MAPEAGPRAAPGEWPEGPGVRPSEAVFAPSMLHPRPVVPPHRVEGGDRLPLDHGARDPQLPTFHSSACWKTHPGTS